MSVAIRVLIADPPWPFRDNLSGKGRGAAKHYTCMPIERIKAYPLPPMETDSVLVLWRVASMLEEAIEVAKAWGFTPKAELVWIKRRRCTACHGSGNVQDQELEPGVVTVKTCLKCLGAGGSGFLGMGWNTRGSHETAMICTKGRNIRRDTPEAKSVPSVFEAFIPTKVESDRVKHSAKPEKLIEIVETLYAGPYHELFARRTRDGWTCEGDQAWKGATA